MDHQDILKALDHTLLTQTATWEEIKQILDDGISCGTRLHSGGLCQTGSAVCGRQAADLYGHWLSKRLQHNRGKSI